MKKSKIIVASQILFMIFISSCSDKSIPTIHQAIPTIPQVENGNFELFVVNGSSDIDPVDIIVLIDGKVAVGQEFLERNAFPTEFQFQLENGIHKFYSFSIKGNISKDTLFTLPATPYCLVAFVYYPKSSGCIEYKGLQITFSEHSFGFM